MSSPSAPPSKASFGSARHSRGSACHAFGVDIGRIGNDEVVARVAQRLEQVAAVQRQPMLEAVIADIVRGDVERNL